MSGLSGFDGCAVVTGGGTGMGRELVRLLAAAGHDVAMCDVNADHMDGTIAAVSADGSDVRLSAHVADVSDPDQVAAFGAAVATAHDTETVALLFNNAGIGGGGSFVADDPSAWQRTFDVCWGGVYHCSRAFMPMLVRSSRGAVVNTSSVNGFWASVGPQSPHTSYSAAKFAVKGFTEALIADFRVHAPHLSAHGGMPGHIGTSIALNSVAQHGGIDVAQVRKQMAARGLPVDDLDDDQIEAAVVARGEAFRDRAPTTAAQAAQIILDGVQAGEWRILVGDDAVALDERVRADPWSAYEPAFMQRLLDDGIFGIFT